MNEAVHVGAVRRFNRFYTRAIGILGDGYPGPGISLTEGRVLYELAQSGTTTATALRRLLRLDAGYLSRMLKGFEARGLVERTVSEGDRRSSELRLTAEGQKAYRALDDLSQSYIGKLIEPLEQADRDQLADAMRTIETLLSREEERGGILLRAHRPGDMGWVVERHGAVYNREHGWDERFEALVARIVAQFIESFDPTCERCWIAEQAGRRVGCVFLVKDDEGMSRLRLLFVDPSARGLGLGRLLVDECIRFARHAGYRGIRLWTQQNLVAARHIYARAGFRMIHGEPHPNFGHDLVSESWELDLETAP
jgi:DNA-binding MarR family transcriptional regulator/N-acetylglutamate synthase-like GNAT family acetyltransferase